MKAVNINDFYPDKGTAVALGDFDGVHTAHKKLIKTCAGLAKENDLLSVVLLFDNHPQKVLRNEDIKEITPFDKKVSIIESLGVDAIVYIKTDKKILSIDPDSFICDVLLGKLRAKYLIAGYNYHFGKNATGNVKMLKEYSQKLGFSVKIIDEIKKDEEIVSSTHIRNLISDGKIKLANEFLGHIFSISGIIEEGKKIGRTLGFPTINIYPKDNQITPKRGVYLTKTKIGDEIYNSITNVGINPTFGGENIRLETHIFDLDKDLYNVPCEVFFLDHIRDEIKFKNKDELKAQIEIDTKKAKNMFDNCQFLC